MKPINTIFPQRISVMANHKCVICGGDAIEFKNDISRREYDISGMCQKCQDKVFVPPKDDPCDGCKGLENPEKYCKKCEV